MTKDEFVQAIESEVAADAARMVTALLESPPGRRPSPSLVTMSRWFNSLDDIGKKHLLDVVRFAADTAVFNFLGVLDGTRPIEDSPSRGKLRLMHTGDGTETLLNGDEGDFLHELFQSLTTVGTT